MDPLRSQIERFAEPLVGTAEAAQDLELRLISAARHVPTDPFDAATDELQRAVQDIALPNMEPIGIRQRGAQREARNSIMRLWSVGPRLAVAALKTIGDIYDENVEVPQTEAAVRHTTTKTLRQIQAGSYIQSRHFMNNVWGLMYATDPSRPQQVAHRLRMANATGALPDLRLLAVDPDSFTVETDEAGQLTINTRYPFVENKPGEKGECPFARTVLKDAGGENRHALTMLLGCIGNTAMDIYSRQEWFERPTPITPTSPEAV
jgi:hypothetical protein